MRFLAMAVLESSGLEVVGEAAAQILVEAPHQLVVIFTAYLSEAIQREADKLGVAACVSKTDVADLPAIINKLAADRG